MPDNQPKVKFCRPTPPEAAVILAAGEKLGAQLGQPIVIPGGPEASSDPIALLMQGDRYVIADLRPYIRRSPLRIVRRVEFSEVASFASYVLAFCQPRNVSTVRIYAEYRSMSATAILDDHATLLESADPPQYVDAPTWCSHRATLVPQNTPAWEAWSGAHRKPMPQVEFAEFIDEHAADIIAPDQATILEAVTSFTQVADVKFASRVNLTNGAVTFGYTEDVRGTPQDGTVSMPRELRLRLAVFEGQPQIEITAKVRYRIAERKLNIGIVIPALETIERAAVRSLLAEVSTLLQLPVLMGTVS